MMNGTIVVFGVNWIGDALMSLPVYAALRRRFPGSRLILITHARVRDLFLHNPHIDRLVCVDKKLSLPRLAGLIPLMRRERAETVILLRPSLGQAVAARLSGAAKVVSHTKRGRSVPGTVSVPFDPALHRMDVYLSLVRSLDAETDPADYGFALTPEEERYGSERRNELPLDKKIVVLHPRTNWELKSWPPAYFAGLADRLVRERGVTVVFTGTREDQPLVRSVMDAMAEDAVDWSGTMALRQFAGFLRTVDLFISADTGAMHLASIAGARCLALFGPTDPELTGPQGRGEVRIVRGDTGNCVVPCYNVSCSDNRCMKSISVETVFDEAAEML